MSNKKNNITGAIILVVIILIVFTSLKPLIKEGIVEKSEDGVYYITEPKKLIQYKIKYLK